MFSRAEEGELSTGLARPTQAPDAYTASRMINMASLRPLPGHFPCRLHNNYKLLSPGMLGNSHGLLKC